MDEKGFEHLSTKAVPAAIVLERDDELINACRRGDPDAQYRLFDVYRNRVFSMALFLCRNAADAADITQEVFLKVFLNVHEFLGDSRFETWLYRIVTNTSADYGRKLRRRILRESVFWWHGSARTPSIEETQFRKQINESVRAAVASLPDKLRVCIVLRYVENLGYDEISAVLGCPPGTVAARLSRAHRMLALKLAKMKG